MVSKKRKKSSKKANSHFQFVNKLRLIPNLKRSQEIFGLSFGMIFAMILIIFFVITAIYVIIAFLHMQECSQLGIFVKDMNEKIDNTWNSNDATLTYTGSVPKSIEYVCFVDLNKRSNGINREIGNTLITFPKKDNFFFYPTKKACEIPGHVISHLDIAYITQDENPFCIKVVDGRINMRIEKQNNEKLVKISK